ncbi:MAG: hypothetical protein EOO40_12355, partial [Deltaproteobacteria bacterium]
MSTLSYPIPLASYSAADAFEPAAKVASPWDPERLWDAVLCQRLIEVSGEARAARLSFAASCILGAQHAGETAAWIQPTDGGLYPPDLHDSGIDLQALSVIHMPRTDRFGLPRAAEILLRSGGFGLVV